MEYLNPRPDVPAPTRTAVIVAVPGADPVVGVHRNRFDRAAAQGVPAHVTVLYPFVHPAQLTDEVIARLAAAVASVPAFACRFAKTAWFGPDVLWLAPEPDRPFLRLTAAVSAAFPSHLPYGGAHGDPVAHLTVAELRFGTSAELLAAEKDVTANLPLGASVTEALLIAGADAPQSWRIVHRLALG